MKNKQPTARLRRKVVPLVLTKRNKSGVRNKRRALLRNCLRLEIHETIARKTMMFIRIT